MQGDPYDQNNAPTIRMPQLPNVAPNNLSNYVPPSRQAPLRAWLIGTISIVGVIVLIAAFVIVRQPRMQAPPLVGSMTATATNALPVTQQPSVVAAVPTVTVAATSTMITALLACAAPPSGADVSDNQLSQFALTLPQGSTAYSVTAQDDTSRNGWAIRTVHLCWSNHTAVATQAGIVFATAWQKVSDASCPLTVPCSLLTVTPKGFESFNQYSSTTVTATEVQLQLASPLRVTARFSPSNNPLVILDKEETKPDLDVAQLPIVKAKNGALVSLPAAGLTYATAQIGTVQHDCGNSGSSYTTGSVTVPVVSGQTSVICARANNGRYFKIGIYYTGSQYMLEWTEWLTVFW